MKYAPSFALIVICASFLTACGSMPQGTSPSSSDVGGGNSLKDRINRETLGIVPDKPRNNSIFDLYNPANNEAGWGRNWTKAVDLSGVSWDGTRTATLVSPLHFVMANHYKRQIGDTVVFQDKKEQKIERQIVGLVTLQADIAVGRLNEPVPLTYYPVLRPSPELAQELAGALVFVTDGERRLHVHEVAAINAGSVTLKHSEMVHKAYWETLVAGDSSNPGFVMIKGKPVLLETHTYGGAGIGPFYSDVVIADAVNAAMVELGGGYQLSFVDP